MSYLISNHVPQVDQREACVVIIAGDLQQKNKTKKTPKQTRNLVMPNFSTLQKVTENGGLTCASNETPLVISSSSDVASAEKRSSPDHRQFKHISEQHSRYPSSKRVSAGFIRQSLYFVLTNCH